MSPGDDNTTAMHAALSDLTHENRPRRRSKLRFKLMAILACLFLLGFVGYAVTRATNTPAARLTFPSASPSVLPAGRLAPAFSLARLGGGQRISLQRMLKKPLVLSFFASWCTDCRQELASLGVVSRQDTKLVQFVGIDSTDANPGLATSLLAHAGATYPVGIDRAGTVTAQYLVSALPVTLFIDTRGRVVGELYGAQSEASLEKAIRGLVAYQATT